MKRPLIVGVRPAGAAEYHFRVFGQAGNRFPPAELRATLHGLAQWLAHGSEGPSGEDAPSPPHPRLM